MDRAVSALFACPLLFPQVGLAVDEDLAEFGTVEWADDPFVFHLIDDPRGAGEIHLQASLEVGG